MSKINNIASRFLGKKVEGFEKYNPMVLVAIPREENRSKYEIKNSNLPFRGYDVWHCYEFSCLTENNVPVTRVLKLFYSCESEYIVESKSLKLYLNSFNMSKFGKDIKECLEICKDKIKKDLKNCLHTNIELEFFDNNKERIVIFDNYKNIMDFADESELKITDFKESPECLKCSNRSKVEEHFLMFDSLRSNCRVTHQPDFGDVYIYYKSNKIIEYESLIKYLVSFRSEYHFHEECCEMIYKRLLNLLDNADKLMVCTLYTRRGGIDISSVRMSENLNLCDIDKLVDLKIFARNGIKQ